MNDVIEWAHATQEGISEKILQYVEEHYKIAAWTGKKYHINEACVDGTESMFEMVYYTCISPTLHTQ